MDEVVQIFTHFSRYAVISISCTETRYVSITEIHSETLLMN